jgi:type VI secretion system protein ImpD
MRSWATPENGPIVTENKGQAAFTQDTSHPEVDFDALLARPAYVVNLDQFLSEKDAQKALVYWLTEHADTATIRTTGDIVRQIDRAISEIDHRINDQLNLIIHHPALQKLEAAWRGLWYLSVQTDNARNIKIKILDISWAEVVKDVTRAMEFDQSQLFNKIYNEGYGIAGGEPFGVLIGDYEVSHRPSVRHPHDDIAALEGLSQIAAASFAPFVAAASSELFGLDSFSGLGLPLDLDAIFAQKEYIRWHSFRESLDARFIGLTAPRILLRRPYRTTPGSYKGIFFYEKSPTAGNEHCLWGNASYGFAAILIREFANVGWFGHIRGVPRNYVGGGILTTLPLDVFETDAEPVAYKPVTDVVITDKLEREISDLGLIPLCQCYGTPYVAFYSNQSVHKPKRQETREADVNARLSAMLQHVLCASRIAHYLKVMIRDKVGLFMTAEQCEELLRRWLFKYTTGREDLEWEEQARYPLREAAVQVKEHPSKRGQFLCVIHLRPHYQLDQMISEMELATELTTQAT